MRTSRLKTAAAVIIGALASAGIAGAEPIRFAWPSAINSGVAPLVFAEKLGLFKREKLELEVVVLTGSGVIVPQLQAGNIDAAYSGLEPAILSHQPGAKDLGIKFIYNYIPSSIWEMAVLEKSDIRSINDLRGKTIGVLALGSSNVLTTRALLQGVGIAAKDVNVQAVGVGAAAYEALRGGQIDVLNLFDTAHKRLELSGTAIRRLELPESFRGSSHGIAILQSRYETRKDYFGRLGRVLAQSNIACDANLEACINAYWEKYPELAPGASQRETVLKLEKQVLVARLANLLNVSDRYGAFKENDWTSLVAALQAGGLVTDPKVSLDLYYTNELVPVYGEFNRDEVVKLAKEAK